MKPMSFRFARVEGTELHWMLRKNCSISPAQLASIFLILASVSLLISSVFGALGATLILPFSLLELLGLAISFLFVARHATDGEFIVLGEGQLKVELESGGKLERFQFNRHTVRIEQAQDAASLIHLSGGGQTVRVGRHIRSELRQVLVQEIKWALNRHSGFGSN